MCYNEGVGADTAFDDWTLTGYSASRNCTIRMFLVAKPFAKIAAAFKSLVTPMQPAVNFA